MFSVEDIGEYYGLQLRSDVIHLAAVFEHFRDTCLTYYGLDPACYMTLPNFAWDATSEMFEI